MKRLVEADSLLEVVAIEPRNSQRPESHSNLVVDHQFGEPCAVEKHYPLHGTGELYGLWGERRGRNEDTLVRPLARQRSAIAAEVSAPMKARAAATSVLLAGIAAA